MSEQIKIICSLFLCFKKMKIIVFFCVKILVYQKIVLSL